MVLWEAARRGSELAVQEGLSERVWGCLPQLSPLPSLLPWPLSERVAPCPSFGHRLLVGCPLRQRPPSQLLDPTPLRPHRWKTPPASDAPLERSPKTADLSRVNRK